MKAADRKSNQFADVVRRGGLVAGASIRLCLSPLLTFLSCILVCISCHDAGKNNTQNTAIDSAYTEPAVAMDSTKDMFPPRSLTADDTIKSMKGVYLQNREGAWVRYTLDGEDISYEMPFAQYLEVLEEQESFYKVRMGYGREADVFFISKERVTDESPANTDLFFPGYRFQIQNFMCDELDIHFPEPDTLDWKPYYDERDIFRGLLVKNDTMFISENLDNGFSGKQIRIIPVNKNDRFNVSYACMQSLNEIEDDRETAVRTPKPKDYTWFSLEQLSAYRPMKDSLLYYFTLPPLGEVEYEANKLPFKQRYKLKDTSFVIPGEYGTYVSFVRNKQYFGYGITHFYLRIERIVNGKVISTRYVVIWINDSC
jgi:hypothetical protein